MQLYKPFLTMFLVLLISVSAILSKQLQSRDQDTTFTDYSESRTLETLDKHLLNRRQAPLWDQKKSTEDSWEKDDVKIEKVTQQPNRDGPNGNYLHVFTGGK